MSAPAEVRAPMPLSVALAFKGDDGFLNRLIQAAAISDEPLAREVASAAIEAVWFQSELTAALARRGVVLPAG